MVCFRWLQSQWRNGRVWMDSTVLWVHACKEKCKFEEVTGVVCLFTTVLVPKNYICRLCGIHCLGANYGMYHVCVAAIPVLNNDFCSVQFTNMLALHTSICAYVCVCALAHRAHEMVLRRLFSHPYHFFVSKSTQYDWHYSITYLFVWCVLGVNVQKCTMEPGLLT